LASIFFDKDASKELKDRNPENLAVLVEMLEQFRFMKPWKNIFSAQAKKEIAHCFKIKKLRAGERIFDDKSEKLNQMHIILAGKTGIYYQDYLQLSNFKADDSYDEAVKIMTKN
jgi:hypothetical protein